MKKGRVCHEGLGGGGEGVISSYQPVESPAVEDASQQGHYEAGLQ
jgi:hypothetical protein